MWGWGFISNHTLEQGSTVPKAPAKTRKVALWVVTITCPGNRSLNGLWGTVSMTYKLMKSDLTAGQNGKQPKTTYPGLRATPASEACKSLLSHAPALMWTRLFSALHLLSAPPACLLLGWGSLWLRPAQQNDAFLGREQLGLFMKTRYSQSVGCKVGFSLFPSCKNASHP